VIWSARISALLIRPEERVREPAHERRGARDRVQALVRVGVAREVPVGRDLPAGEVDRLQARLHHLHGLSARQRAERRDEGLGVEEAPEPLGAESRERVLDVEATAEALDVGRAVRPLDACPPFAAVRRHSAHLPLPRSGCVQN